MCVVVVVYGVEVLVMFVYDEEDCMVYLQFGYQCVKCGIDQGVEFVVVGYFFVYVVQCGQWLQCGCGGYQCVVGQDFQFFDVVDVGVEQLEYVGYVGV